jgi:hypothetical protein
MQCNVHATSCKPNKTVKTWYQNGVDRRDMPLVEYYWLLDLKKFTESHSKQIVTTH